MSTPAASDPGTSGGTDRRPARLVDVAAAAGVSVSTVSYVINDPDRVGAATLERVRRSMADLDYVPHDTAVTLRRGTSRSVGLVVPDVTNPFYARLARGAAAAAHEQRYAVVLCDSADDAGREHDYLGMLAEQRAAGAVVAPLGADPARLARLRDRGVRVVLLDRAAPGASACSVSVDDVRGGHLAVERLTARGHRRVALVNGARTIRQCEDRWAGAAAAAATAGAELHEVTVAEMTTAEGERAATALLGGADSPTDRTIDNPADRPTAVFATNDQLAIGVVRAALALGLRVPDDVAVVGYGDLDIAGYAPVPLTTVAQPLDAMGRTAVELVLGEVGDGARHVHRGVVLQPRLVVRTTA